MGNVNYKKSIVITPKRKQYPLITKILLFTITLANKLSDKYVNIKEKINPTIHGIIVSTLIIDRILSKEKINEPNVTGISIKNINSDAFSFSIPAPLAPKYVIPLLDIPGIIPIPWNNPIINDLLYVISLFLLGSLYVI